VLGKSGVIASFLLGTLGAGCTTKNPYFCEDGVCIDPARPFCDIDGSVAGDPGVCLAVTCAPEMPSACQGESSVTCNATGTNFDVTPCNHGCNDQTFVCNVCEPSTASCSGDVLESCGEDGVVASTETCTGGCVTSPNAHCAHLTPRYVPDICDSAATSPTFVVSTSGTLDTSLDQNCNGGVVDQPGTRPLCVMRYGTIKITQGATLKLTGTRPVAIVADRDFEIAGAIDASADNMPVGTSGPGGGATLSGSSALGTKAGGGAGFRVAGAAGGGPTADGGGGIGGVASVNPGTFAALIGGPRCGDVAGGINGGGGGGGVALISCRGTVSVSGVIDAGGGGGFGSFLTTLGGGGGGAGGYIVIQGMDISVTGQIYANGGAGGAGVGSIQGFPGEDGSLSQSIPANGGPSQGGSGAGGCGAWDTGPPCTGKAPTSAGRTAGGGGGSTGFIKFYLPTGRNATIAPVGISPPLDPVSPIPLR